MRGGALFKGKEGRGDFRKEIPHHCFLNPLLKLERCPLNPSVTCENRIYFPPSPFKRFKKSIIIVYKFPYMGTLFYFIFSIFAPCYTDIEPYYLL